MFILYVLIILFIRWVFLLFTKKMRINNRKVLKQMDSLIRHILNGVTTYRILLFMLKVRELILKVAQDERTASDVVLLVPNHL